MKRLAFYLAIMATILVSCQKEVVDNFAGNNNNVIDLENQRLDAKITKQSTQTWLNGYIVNEQQQPVAGALVECGGKTATTDSKGFFLFTAKLTVNKDYAVIKVTKTGYMDGFRTFTPNRQQLAYRTEKIMLQTTNTAQQVPATGGVITIDGIKLTFPANAIVRPGGATYTGNVSVFVRYIDPNSSGFSLISPGMLSGLNDAGQIRSLQSLGMAHVELRDASGAVLEIAGGMRVKMEMPAVAAGPATIPLWHFNEKYGIWIQQGTASKQGNVYVAEVNHFSIWNLDIEFNSFELNLKFQTAAQVPLPNLRVDVYRPNNSFVIGFYTDNAGEATLINCSSNETLTLKIGFPCDTLTYTLAPVTQTRSETITVNSPSLQNYQFAGTLFSCNSQPLTNQPYQLYVSGPSSFVVLNGITDGQGRINTGTTIPNCLGASLDAQTSAYYNNRFYFSSTTTVQPGPNVYNATLCDSTGTGGLFNDSDIVNIPDPSLRQRVRDVINKPTGTIYYIDVKNLRTLEAYSVPPIATLVGLQFFTGLDTLAIGPINGITHTFTDLTPVKDLTQLKYLQFARGTVSDISPLQNLTTLKDLYLQDNQITNISIIQNLAGLKTLWLPGNVLQSLTPIQGLTGLKDLSLASCQLTNISALQNLVNINFLDLRYNPITSISAMQNMSSLIILSMSRCQVADIGPLQNLNLLQTVYLDSNNISSIAPLQNKPALVYADLSDNQISTIPSLNNDTSLITLDLSDNQISSLTPLQGHPKLRSLNLNNNLITDITALQNITTLRLLGLNANAITNLTPLGGINLLQVLYLYSNNLTTIAPLITSNPNLQRIYLLQGNVIPAGEITSFQGTHPACQVL